MLYDETAIKKHTIAKIEWLIAQPQVKEWVTDLAITRGEIVAQWPVIDYVLANLGYDLQRNEQDGQLEMVVTTAQFVKQHARRYNARWPRLKGEVVSVHPYFEDHNPKTIFYLQQPDQDEDKRCVVWRPTANLALAIGDQVEFRARKGRYKDRDSYDVDEQSIIKK